ncbi:MAG: hypothetical protein JO333_21210 [Verrucomicrobia bacterium]|nr:hypothetical protein [Verrucomicrobiota bacterium]
MAHPLIAFSLARLSSVSGRMPIGTDVSSPSVTKSRGPLIWIDLETALAHRPDLDALAGKFRVIDTIAANGTQVDARVRVFADLAN